MAGAERDIQPHRVLIDPDAQAASERLRRQTLFMGLSDGARIDTIRHANPGLLGNEQFVQGTQVDTDKWRDLLDNLREGLNDSSARFRLVYLVDDFAGTGTSLLRFDEKTSKWKDKLIRFKDSVESANGVLDGDRLFEDGWLLCVHHYLVSSAAAEAIRERLARSADSDISRGAHHGPDNCTAEITASISLWTCRRSTGTQRAVRMHYVVTRGQRDKALEEVRITNLRGIEHLQILLRLGRLSSGFPQWFRQIDSVVRLRRRAPGTGTQPMGFRSQPAVHVLHQSAARPCHRTRRPGPSSSSSTCTGVIVVPWSGRRGTIAGPGAETANPEGRSIRAPSRFSRVRLRYGPSGEARQ